MLAALSSDWAFGVCSVRVEQDEVDSMYKVLVVDDHPVIGEALIHALSKSKIVGTVTVAHTARAAQEQFRVDEHDLVMIDLDLPDMAGPDLIRMLRLRCPTVRVLVYTSKRYEMYSCRLRSMNISGFIPKSEQLDKVASVVELVAQGYAVLPRSGPASADNPFNLLSNRELSVVQAILRGQNNHDIAHDLHISQKTVAVHKMNLFRKLGAVSVIDVVELARMHDFK